MAKAFSALLAITLLSLTVWQYVRLSQFEKDVHYHHYERCKRFEVGLEIVDMTRFGDISLALARDGGVYSVHGLVYGTPVFNRVPIAGTPSGFTMHPLGFFLHKNATLFVLTQAESQTEVVLLDLDEAGETVSAWLNSSFVLPSALHGTVTDLIAFESSEIYLAQTYAVPQSGSALDSAQHIAHEVLGLESTSVHHCNYSATPVTCRTLNNTLAVSVTGITMNKFGSYFVSFATADANWVNVYERKRNGDFSFVQKIPLRDKAEKIDHDLLHQRTYGGAVPFPYAAPGPSGVVELTSWEMRSYHTYRNLVMQDGALLKGATCAARGQTNIMVASKTERAVLVCPIYAPFI